MSESMINWLLCEIAERENEPVDEPATMLELEMAIAKAERRVAGKC